MGGKLVIWGLLGVEPSSFSEFACLLPVLTGQDRSSKYLWFWVLGFVCFLVIYVCICVYIYVYSTDRKCRYHVYGFLQFHKLDTPS